MAATSNKTETYALDNATHDTTAVATLAAALTAQSGLPMTRARGVSFVVSAPEGETIASGNMRCYVYRPTVVSADGSFAAADVRWMAHTALDLAVGTSVRDWPSGDMESFTGVLRVIWLPDAVTVSDSTDETLGVTMTVDRWQL